MIAEKSNSYLEKPEASTRILAALPQAKMIVQMRNPVERAYSDYCMLYRRGEVDRRIERHLDPASASDQRFISSGHYDEQLARFLRCFDREQFLILLYEDIATAPERQAQQVRDFLGLQKAEFPESLAAKVKDKTTKIVPPSLQRFAKPLRPLIEPLRGTAAFSSLAAQLRREVNYPVLTDTLRAKLTDHFAPHIDALETAIGKDLSAWRSKQTHAA